MTGHMARSVTVGMNVGPEARDAARALTYRLTGQAGRRVTMTEAIIAACSVATADLAATLAAMAQTAKGD